MEQAEKAEHAVGQERIQLFQYPATPGAPGAACWHGWMEESDPRSEKEQKPAGSGSESGDPVHFEQRHAEETRRSFESGREHGRQEGRQAEREVYAAELQAIEERRARQAAEILENFGKASDQYLEAVEQEVVRLALAIAARILRREAQMDPLLLTGAVRVALGQLSGLTEVRLQVPAAELELWGTAIALIPNLALKPTVTAGDDMRLGDCRIETVLGSVDLGVRSQLGEIERGFFDRCPGSKIKVTEGALSIPVETGS